MTPSPPTLTTTTSEDRHGEPSADGRASPRRRRAMLAAGDRLRPFGAVQRRRRPWLLGVSIVTVVACGAVISTAFSSVSSHATIVVAKKSVPAGAAITASDISSANLSGTGSVSAIAWVHASSLVGHRAKIAIAKGEVIPRAAIGNLVRLDPGNEAVGMSLSVDELPASGLLPGETVQVVEVAAPGSPSAPAVSAPPAQGAGGTASPFAPAATFAPGTVVVPSATVLAAWAPPPTGGASYAEVVSLEVPNLIAPDVVALAAAHEIGLALEPAEAATTQPGGPAT